MIEDVVKKIVWLGHDGFRIDADKIIYIDPFEIAPENQSSPEADLILITHEHYDHCSAEDIAKIKGDKSIIITEKNSAAQLSGDVRIMKPGDVLTVDGIKIETVPSYNTDKQFHPKENGWLGFIIEIQGVRIYHAGDADFIPEMKDLNVDIALLPVSGTYVMTAAQAVEAALAINPKLAIPMHYGAIVGSEQDALDFKQALEGKVDVLILSKG
ncbi:MBL fold metallo-hydrolase [Desulfococcaceae bacterium HSG9]|nr:MBL fold metallo-hydrolase [Desulfococcaceae bacterium HSG9]